MKKNTLYKVRWKSLIGKRRVTTNSRVRCPQITHHPLPPPSFSTIKKSFLQDNCWRKTTNNYRRKLIIPNTKNECTLKLQLLKEPHSDHCWKLEAQRNKTLFEIVHPVPPTTILLYTQFIYSLEF